MTKFILQFFTLILLSAFHLSYANTIQDGLDYTTLKNALNLNTKENKISIVEIFAYECPHCAQLEPKFQIWANKNKDRIEVRRIPLPLSQRAEPLGNMYYALQALANKPLEKNPYLSQEIFKEVQKKGAALLNLQAQADFLVKHKVDSQKYIEAYKNLSKPIPPFSHTAKDLDTILLSDDKAKKESIIKGVPAIIVNRKWLVEPQTPRSPNTDTLDQMLSIVNALVEKAIAEKAASK